MYKDLKESHNKNHGYPWIYSLPASSSIQTSLWVLKLKSSLLVGVVYLYNGGRKPAMKRTTLVQAIDDYKKRLDGCVAVSKKTLSNEVNIIIMRD